MSELCICFGRCGLERSTWTDGDLCYMLLSLCLSSGGDINAHHSFP
jgi:hypothetical protein